MGMTHGMVHNYKLRLTLCGPMIREVIREVKIVLKISKKVDQEEPEKINLLAPYNEVREKERKLDKSKPP